ncbi:hypothetical protein MesoLj113c_21390 [Mesorhizobium sp. 113-3-9]|nr:hypothetical protein MesoLj113c_21390 [Mesorhizobium sp. 113-3-9]
MAARPAEDVVDLTPHGAIAERRIGDPIYDRRYRYHLLAHWRDQVSGIKPAKLIAM